MTASPAASATAQRVALVTGAARGIGAATVRQLVADGLHVIALDWCAGDDSAVEYPQAHEKDLQALVDSLPAGRVVPVVGDVRSPATLARAVRAALENWGRLDVAVAGAAVMAGGAPLWEDDCLPLLWEIDVVGVWNTAAAAVPAMLAGPDPSGCRFVSLASSAGEHGLYHLAAYTTVKHAVVGLVRGLAADLVGTGVTAAAVSPGSTDTTMLTATAGLYGVTVGELADHQLLKRPLAPEELAAAIAFACSPEGAVLNGSILNADGGFSA
ncbi:mycofactocin-coupled SDR family oxidoreductase [Streptomyces sp. JW3]|uniref:mycofactocin-coupled SDR family oxidoreductase n=1 Tax=Streptomyces sp. JW3 TaxID=3456955 RepID=UPI003FA4AEEE